MLADERHQRIRALVATLGRVATDRIAADLGVSRETVRRDLVELEARGALRRVHGGVLAPRPAAEPPLAERSRIRLREKQAIARAAALKIEPGQTLFLDAGSTVSELAAVLATLTGLTIVTNSFEVAGRIAMAGADTRGLEVIQLGGRVVPGAGATLGAATIAEALRHHADWALLSPVAVDAGAGATSHDHDEAELARAMTARADRVAILADHAKIGQRSRVGYCPAERIDLLVTDARARDLPALEALTDLVGEVVIA
ncbi:DeoR/GlpR family DNA-binding transcription regulator [Tistrella mobilis]|uniref:DeoR/GlpR family DNA-binding transcription regulator n=1 Tax=Tistrella mobilis TaxID=171437 RepID=UPI003557FA37